MEPVKPSGLATAARVADAVVYVVGVAGVLAGGVLLRQDDIAWAAVAWCLTFVAGAGLRLAAWLTRGVAQLLQQQQRLLDEVADLRVERARGEPPRAPQAPSDPYGRWGSGWH